MFGTKLENSFRAIYAPESDDCKPCKEFGNGIINIKYYLDLTGNKFLKEKE